MTRIVKNVDLNDGVTNNFDAWETCAATAFDVVVYTGNWFAAYSEDRGTTFTAMNPGQLCEAHGEALAGDQVVIYIPRINQFAWLLQTRAGNYVLALASPEEIRQSKGRGWISWLIRASRFGDANDKADYPEVAVGDNFLYVTFNLTGKYSIALRLSLAELQARGSIHLIYYAAKNNFWLRPAQSTGDSGYFVAENSASELRVFSWPEQSNRISHFDVQIATIPTEDFPVRTPAGDEWLDANSKVDWHIYGTTRTGGQVWAAWNGARKVHGQSDNAFNYPHIGLAVIDIQSKRLIQQRYIWNPEFAFAWPSLATNVFGDVGLSYCWGGNKRYPQYGVAILTGPHQNFTTMTSGVTTGAGGHYTSVRENFPDGETFCGSGFNQIKISDPPSLINHPHYVLFQAE